MTEHDAPRGVLWDLDGTLVDSTALHFEAWQRVLADLGRALVFEDFRATFGLRNDRVVPRLLGHDVDPDEGVRLAERKEALYRDLVRERGVQAAPGALEWVARLRAAGWRQALATSAPRVNAETLLDATGLISAFDARVTAEDVSHGKPDPEIFLAAAARLGVAPARAIVVEDARSGIEAARRAGMKSIGVLSSFDALGADLDAAALDRLPADAFDTLLGR